MDFYKTATKIVQLVCQKRLSARHFTKALLFNPHYEVTRWKLILSEDIKLNKISEVSNIDNYIYSLK